MKRELSFLLVMACLLGGQTAEAESAPAVYRVTDGQGRQAFLLGTVNVGKKEGVSLGKAFEEAWRQADRLAVEADAEALDTDPALRARYASVLRCGPGDEAKKRLSPEAYGLGIAKLGLNEDTLNRLLPAAWVSLAEQKMYASLGLSGEEGTERRLLRRARAEGKPVEELEGAEEQMRLMQRMPDAVMDGTLLSLLRDPEAASASALELIEAWAAGDRETFAARYEQEMADHPPEYEAEYAAYYRMVYQDRNRHFFDRITVGLEQGETVLYAVGAAHVLGRGALLDMLEDAGYAVEIMAP